MKKKLMILAGFVLMGLAPVAAFAQTTVPVTTGGFKACTNGPVTDVGGVICKIAQIVNAVIPVLIAIAVLYFIWGVIQFVIANDEEAKTRGRDRMIYGIIGLAVIIGLWGFVNILKNTFLPEGNAQIIYPTVPY